MSFKDMISRDSQTSLLAGNDVLEESITWKPAVGSQKTIKAIVFREGLKTVPEYQDRSTTKQVQIFIANDATNGVTAVSIRLDKVSLPWIEGETATDWIVSKVISKDQGGWMLLCTGGK